MIRKTVPYIRKDWQKKVEEIGFGFYEVDGLPYWDESAYYQFTSDQVDKLEEATEELYGMCLKLVDYVVSHDLFERLGIPAPFHDYVRQSWRKQEATIYGRFDFQYEGKGEPKLLEFNADTPTALFEASVVQYSGSRISILPRTSSIPFTKSSWMSWITGCTPWRTEEGLLFSSVRGSLEDYTTSEYLRDVAMQAGIETGQIFIDDVGYDHDRRRFVDLEENEIRCIFKLYPWEWMLKEPFAEYLLSTDVTLFEPPWKMILSNKAILPLLWEMYPNHPNLLAAHFEPPELYAPRRETLLLEGGGGHHNRHVVFAWEGADHISGVQRASLLFR